MWVDGPRQVSWLAFGVEREGNVAVFHCLLHPTLLAAVLTGLEPLGLDFFEFFGTHVVV